MAHGGKIGGAEGGERGPGKARRADKIAGKTACETREEAARGGHLNPYFRYRSCHK